MRHALTEWAPVALAVERGRQVVLLVDRPMPEPREFLLLPVFVDAADRHVEPEAESLVEDARARYDLPDGRGVTTWCRLVGLLPVDEGRTAAVTGAGVWDRDVVDHLRSGGDAYLAFVEPHLLDPPLTLDPDELRETAPDAADAVEAGDRGRLVDLGLDVDTAGSHAVLGDRELRDRHGLLKTALGVQV